MIVRMLLALVVTVLATPSGAQDREALVARGRGLFVDRNCLVCHTVGVVGTPIASDLSRVGTRYRETDLVRWLRDPSAQRPTLHMPGLGLSKAEAEALAAYLGSLR